MDSEKMVPEWPEPGWGGHRRQQARDVLRYTTPEERLAWLEDMILIFQPAPRPLDWPAASKEKPVEVAHAEADPEQQ